MHDLIRHIQYHRPIHHHQLTKHFFAPTDLPTPLQQVGEGDGEDHFVDDLLLDDSLQRLDCAQDFSVARVLRILAGLGDVTD